MSMESVPAGKVRIVAIGDDEIQIDGPYQRITMDSRELIYKVTAAIRQYRMDNTPSPKRVA